MTSPDDDTTYTGTEGEEEDYVMETPDPDSAIDDVLESGRYGESGEAELYSIAPRTPMKNDEPMLDRNGVVLTYMDLGVAVYDESGGKKFVHSSMFGKNTRTEKATGSQWPRFARQLDIKPGQKMSELLPMKVVVDVATRDSNKAVVGPDGQPTGEVDKRRFASIVDIRPYQGGEA